MDKLKQVLKSCFNFYLLIHSLLLPAMLKDIIILLLIGYLVYKILSRFVLPLLNMTSIVSSNMRKMQEQMNAQMERENVRNNSGYNDKNVKPKKEGDYIDYEEIK